MSESEGNGNSGDDNSEKDEAEVNQDEASTSNGVMMEYKRLRFVENPVENSENSEVPLDDQNCILLYPCIFDGDDNLSMPESESIGQLARQFQNEPQVIMSDFFPAEKEPIFTVQSSAASLENIRRPGVIVAAASSSGIGDSSIQDEDDYYVNVQIGEDKGEVLLRESVSMTMVPSVKQEATPENLVSSTSGPGFDLNMLATINLKPFAKYDMTPHSDFMFYEDRPLSPENLFANSVEGEENRSAAVESVVIEIGRSIDQGDERRLVGNGIEDEGVEDDDSSEILKDETDTAEEDTQSEDEMTDSASETEAILQNQPGRKVKPVITISDQYFPRLVIDFGANGQTEVLEVVKSRAASCHCQIRTTAPTLNRDNGNGHNSGFSNNNEKMDSNISSGTDNWVEIARCCIKRKRTDSDQQEGSESEANNEL